MCVVQQPHKPLRLASVWHGLASSYGIGGAVYVKRLITSYRDEENAD
jgi:hypothetical protein